MAKLGLNAKLYRGVAGSTASDEIVNVIDLTYNDERNEADISTRACQVELSASTTRKFSLGWSMPWDEADADFSAILTAYVANTALAFKCISSSGGAANGTGIDADFVILKCARKEDLKGALMADIEIKPTYITRYPAAVTGA